MTAIDDLLTNADRWAEGFDTPGLPPEPALKVTIVTCMDARFLPGRVLDIHAGDVHLLRNAGGVVTDDVLRSLAVSQRKLATREVVLLHHTKCGMATFTDDDFVAELESETGQKPTWAPGTFRDTEQDVRDSLAAVRSSPFLAHTDAVRGFVYDVDSGALTEVS
mgnify:CR=1 FL=1